ncbi:MAG: cardiolipin synthase [Anaerovoracaceae bacterium]
MFTALFAMGFWIVNILSMATIIFVRRKEMSTTYAWLLVLIFIPVFGLLLYFFFGSTKKLEIMSKKYRLSKIEEKYMDALNDHISMVKSGQIEFANPKTASYRDMVTINATNGRAFFSEDNSVELLVNGQNKFPKMFEEIRAAKESINVMYFIIKSKDPIGKELINLLAMKAAEGVQVKVLYDGLGCLKTKMKDFDPIIKQGGKVQKFLPSTIRTLMTANYRLHRKMVIIDGQICYTGGINVGDDYLGNYAHITPWRDTSIRVTGSAVSELQIIFFRDWIFCAKQNKKFNQSERTVKQLNGMKEMYFPDTVYDGNVGMQVISFGPDMKYAVHKDSYVKMCTSAKEYLYIQSPYFVPDESLLDAIRMAAQSGIDVRLMLPGIADKGFVYKVAMSYVEELLEAGVRIYTHKGFLHAKTMVIDDYVSSVGTTNLDIRSFRLDYEVNVLSYDETFAKKCKETFLNDINDSKEIDLEEFKKRSYGDKFKESLCRFFIPLS